MVFVTASVGPQHRQEKLQLQVKPHFPPRGGAGPLLSSAGLVTTKAFPVSRSPRRFLPPSGSSGHYSVPGEVTLDTSQLLLGESCFRTSAPRAGEGGLTHTYGWPLLCRHLRRLAAITQPSSCDGIHTHHHVAGRLWQAGCGRPQPLYQ